MYGNPQSVRGAWTPLRVTLTNIAPLEADGLMDVTVPGPNGAIDLRSNANAPPDSRVSRTILAPPLPAECGAKHKTGKSLVFTWNVAGSQVAQTELLPWPSDDDTDTTRRSTLLNLIGDRFAENSASDFQSLCKTIARVTQTPMILWQGPIDHAARLPAAYDSCRVIALSGGSAQSLDPMQRQTLIDFVRAGGVLLISSPVSVDDVRGTWIEPYMPVRVIGHRTATCINDSTGPINLREPAEICEAVAADGTELISDGAYVHAAYRPLGLGRVAFTSFPVDAPAFDQLAANRFWSDLLDLSSTDPSWDSSALPQRLPEIMGQMIGTPAPPRQMAIGLALGFVALVVSAHLAWRGVRRPLAIATSSGVALLEAALLVAMGIANQGKAPLTSGQIAVAHLSADGGYLQEAAAFTGNEAVLSLSTTSPQATLWPSVYDGSNTPVLTVNPFTAPSAGAAARRIDRIWEASMPAPTTLSASAGGEFDENGLTLSIANRTGSTLGSPILIYGTSVWRLQELAEGASKVTVMAAARNAPVPTATDSEPADVLARSEAQREQSLRYINAGPILSDEDMLRGQVLAALATRSSESANMNVGSSRPWIAGWMGGVAPLTIASLSPQVERVLTLATFPLSFGPSPVGALVRIDAGFNTTLIAPGQLPIYSAEDGTWVTCSQPGSWEIGFRPPPQIGHLQLTRAVLRANVNLPGQIMTLRREQVRGGKLSVNPSGAVIAEWSNTFGRLPAVAVDLSPEDVDAVGVVWVLVNVEHANAETDGTTQLWGITELGMTLEGRVEAR